MVMEIRKSSRHSKITGDFGEAVVLYWLSKHGFECARVDHTGIDIIARNPQNQELMGISVKSRSRSLGTEGTSLVIRRSDLAKAQEACKAFGCQPYYAIVVDAGGLINAFLLSIQRLLQMHPRGSKTINWSMQPKALAEYSADPHIKHFVFNTETRCWW
jgi:Holliday junction resolvase-like predicted endonuclease